MNPKDVPAWLTMGTTLVVWAFTAGVIWTKLNGRINLNRSQLNGLGGRLKTQESAHSVLEGRMDGTERQISIMTQHSADINGRLGRVEARVEAVDSHMSEFKLELFQHLGEVKQLITTENAATRQILNDRDANLRERLARVEERRGILHEER